MYMFSVLQWNHDHLPEPMVVEEVETVSYSFRVATNGPDNISEIIENTPQ